VTLNLTIVAVYLVGMLAFGWWGKTRAASSEDYLVAGRRLGPVLRPSLAAGRALDLPPRLWDRRVGDVVLRPAIRASQPHGAPCRP
jgi:hypothetical protein